MGKEMARRTDIAVTADGVDITRDLRPYLLTLTYTDNEEDRTDDLQITLQDREQRWMDHWLGEVIQGAAAARLKLTAQIIQRDWTGPGKDRVLPCGSFEVDSVTADGPPSAVTVKATSLAFSQSIRQTDKSKAWEGCRLSGIAREMAENAGMALLYEAGEDPYYRRVEQMKTSDIQFLSQLCHGQGISLKATADKLVLFDQRAYEGKDPVRTLRRKAGGYSSYTLETGSADSQYASCRVSYTNGRGKVIQGTYTDPELAEKAGADSAQRLEITARADSPGEAETLAKKHLRLHNRFARTASFTLAGDPTLAAGEVLRLEGWGAWDGNYIVKQAQHTVGTGGYTTKLALRACLGY